MKKLLKFNLIAIYIITVTVTILLVYSCTDIYFNTNTRYSMEHNIIYNNNIIFKHEEEGGGFSSSENLALHLISSFYNIKGEQLYSISIPKEFPFIYSAIVDKWLFARLTKDKKLENKIIRIIESMFNGNRNKFFHNMSKSNQLFIDEKIVISIAKEYNINTYLLYKYYLSVPVNHELGHVYVKLTSYSEFGVDYQIPVFIDEFAAEYVSAITSLSMIKNDPKIKNKKKFIKAIVDIYILSRTRQTESLGDHTGTAFVSELLLNENSRIYKDATILSNTSYPKVFVKNVVREIINRSSKEPRFQDNFLLIYLDYKNKKKDKKRLNAMSVNINKRILSIIDFLYKDFYEK